MYYTLVNISLDGKDVDSDDEESDKNCVPWMKQPGMATMVGVGPKMLWWWKAYISIFDPLQF